MATADVDLINCRAVIIDGSRLFSFEADRDPPLNEESRAFRVGMFLQPAIAKSLGESIRSYDAGEYPYTEFQAEMLRYKKKRDALDYFLQSLDTEFETPQREYRAKRAEDLINADPEIADEIERVVLSQPLPKVFNTEIGPQNGRAGEIFRKLAAMQS